MKISRRKQNTKLKKVLLIALACIMSAAALVGIIFGIRKSVRGTRTIVVQGEELAGYGFGSDFEMESMEGEIYSGAAQTVYLAPSMTVKEVKVKEGQSVKRGDTLLEYDTKKLELNEKKEELSRVRIGKAIDIAERNLRTLRAMKPVSDDDFDDDDDEDIDDDMDDFDDDDTDTSKNKKTTKKSEKKSSEKKKTTETNPYKNVKAVAVLNGKSKAYNDVKTEKNLGTEANPYRFLCRDEAVIEGGFIQAMKAKAKKAGKSVYFVVEVRKGDKGSGALQKLWLQDAKLLADVDDSWRGTLRFAEEAAEDEDEQEPPEDPSVDPPSDPDDGQSGDDDGSGDEGSNPGDADGTDPDGSGTPAEGTGSAQGRYRVVLLSSWDDEDDEDDDDWSEYADAESLIPADAEYTASELREAIIEETENLENLKLSLKEADLKIKKAKKAMKNGTVKASSDGVVIKAGDPKNPPADGSAFLMVGAAKGLSVRGAVSERRLDSISPGDTVRVMSWQSGEELTAKIVDISPYPDSSGRFSQGESNTSYYPFTANILDGGSELEEGEWVELSFDGSMSYSEDEDEEFAETFYLMKAFIRSDQKGKYVLVRGKGKKLTKRYIEVGKNTGDAYEIVSGVSEEDWIAFPYGKNAREGAPTREGTFEDLESM